MPNVEMHTVESYNCHTMPTIKNIIAVITMMLIASSISFAQAKEQPAAASYDAELSKRLGADGRGMKLYVLCILKTGPRDEQIKGKPIGW